MILSALCGTIVFLALFVLFGLTGLLEAGTMKTVLRVVFLIGAVVLALVTVWMWLMHRAFSYDGKRQMSRQIIDGTADYK